MSVYKLYDFNGMTCIRRNKYPRFSGRVTMGDMSLIEEIVLIDESPSTMELAAAVRKAGEFLCKGGRRRENRD
ncbi:MAG: hypothetical protein LBF89_00010 [Bacteroidales bacterium]|jgi:hypothetical protein|nr:hypothetical protein [Bacteroidales bacterium]